MPKEESCKHNLVGSYKDNDMNRLDYET